MRKEKIVYKSVDELIPYVNNPRNNDGAVDAVASSIKNFGFKVPIVIDSNNEIINGHTRLKSAKKLGMKEVPVIVANDLTEAEAKAFRLADNKTSELAEWDYELLGSELELLTDNINLNFDMEEFGFDLDFEPSKYGDDYDFNDVYNDYEKGSIKRDFLVNPFSVIDTAKKHWLDRKQWWFDRGLRGEVGRDDYLIFSQRLNTSNTKGTSIFDPCLCEVCYEWFSNEGHHIYDPFAGGPVRGIVASYKGRKYTGIDLREEQIEVNYANADEMEINDGITWIADDSLNVDKYLDDNSIDYIFTCPPYYDLEVYSDLEEDISNMDYEDFKKTYRDILTKACNKLKDNRFATIVISDVRDEKGAYRRLCDLTRDIFEDNGLYYYNEIVLRNVETSAGIRARRNMTSRKVVRTHQNVLVFYKGDMKEIKNEFPEIVNVAEDEEEVDDEV